MKTRVRRHLAEVADHRGCPEALRRMRATVAALADESPAARHSRGVWAAIEARLGIAPRSRRALPLAIAAGIAAAALGAWQLERAAARRRGASGKRSQER